MNNFNPEALIEIIKDIKEKFKQEPMGNLKREIPVVCLCGSGRFKNSYIAASELLTANGIIVLMPGIFKNNSLICEVSKTKIDKEMLDRLHLEKLKMSNAGIVIAEASEKYPYGYIGESTSKEIEFMKKINLPIYYITSSLDTSLISF